MRYTGIQPQYFPRLHYFSRIINTDIFMIRDEVQFVRSHKYPNGENDKSYQADTIIKQPAGKFYLSIPVEHQQLLPIKDIRVSYQHEWVSKHLPTIRTAYGQAKYFSEIFPQLIMLLKSKPSHLSTLTTKTIFWGLFRLLGQEKFTANDLTLKRVNEMLKKQQLMRLKEIHLASKSKALSKLSNPNANEKILSLIKESGANEDYCGGTAHQAYMDESLFERNGIKVVVQDWTCQEYPQRFMHRTEFIPNLSIIDLLMNVSSKESLAFLAE